ncbi:glycoside hydrolase family 72 carbohydrate-binding module family 43 protein [Pseudocercospora fijiensis CIRAD86]|uniref:1,3-beta-glucanosyltransferase n=1 Tax=Pseudocercospora fijiensis (strain CIRAD86) TaxID=383855 RepID=M3AV09_PSEFD|nr:glycoside hydrolase family 72 carbohydrate-binding module family 43 protein [Pseudocercospora fijiensis CIRAD86]EME81322.1 glycoside hydrolase family 72 carbohydrate-binding module family 43 protein [Pseudocercospora fijiensis CIRAD86]
MLYLRAFAATIGVLVTYLIADVSGQDIDTIVIKGSKFFYSGNGTQFFIKGVAYQQDFQPGRGQPSNGYNDPLADTAGCMRDIPYLKQLDTNTIRVYAIDPTQDHSECMTALANAGIYVLADLAAPNESIDSNDPSWNTELYARYTSVVDEMQKYSNLLGFFAGNEIVTQPNVTASAAFAKAAVRDMKAYIRSKKYRAIGVGYATSDNADIRVPLANYMDCGNSSDAIDFWGYNVYSWCGDSSFSTSGYQTRTEELASYNVPVFFAEYGCNTVQPRTFTDVPVLFGPQMDDVWSGGIIYLYFQEVNDYGLVSIDGNSVSTLVDFNNLKSQITTVSPSGPNSASYSPTNSPQSCPTKNSAFSAATNLPPTPDTSLCDCMYNSLGCVPSNDVDADSYGDLFSYVCGDNANLCNGIARNGTTGQYGQFGMCSPKQQLGYVLNQYYSSRGADATACRFSGSAVTQAAASATGSCATQLSAASSANPAAGSASSSQGVGAVNPVAGMDVGYVSLAVLLQVAIISGVGMIWL